MGNFPAEFMDISACPALRAAFLVQEAQSGSPLAAETPWDELQGGAAPQPGSGVSSGRGDSDSQG